MRRPQSSCSKMYSGKEIEKLIPINTQRNLNSTLKLRYKYHLG